MHSKGKNRTMAIATVLIKARKTKKYIILIRRTSFMSLLLLLLESLDVVSFLIKGHVHIKH